MVSPWGQLPPQSFGGAWYRGRCRIAGGRIVLGADLERYRPWQDFEAARAAADGRIAPAYQELVHLVRRLDRGELDQQAQDHEIAAWCSAHGVLGLEPAIPVLAGDESDAFEDETDDEFDRQMAAVTGEAVDVFLGGARRLVGILDGLCELKRVKRHAQPPAAVVAAIADLDEILSEQVRRRVTFDGDTVRPHPRWLFRSLFGCLAEMIFFDSQHPGRAWRRCARCNEVFSAKANYSQKHCSAYCRERAKYEARKSAVRRGRSAAQRKGARRGKSAR